MALLPVWWGLIVAFGRDGLRVSGRGSRAFLRAGGVPSGSRWTGLTPDS